ncbi:PDZ domain-containing protein [bacterium]|nr:PDZ domain-containing protein [bacterium]
MNEPVDTPLTVPPDSDRKASVRSFLNKLTRRSKQRRRFVVGTAVAAICGLLAGVISFRLLPGLSARDLLPAFVLPHGAGGEPRSSQGPDNRLLERHTRRLTLQTTGSDAGPDGARQLAQAILATVRNFYVDADRVTDQQIGELLVKVIRRKSGQFQASIDGNAIVLSENGKASRYQLNPAGMVDAVAAVSTAMASTAAENPEADDSSVEPAQKCRDLLNALVAELDPHSSVMSPSAYSELRQGTEGSFGGLGVLVGIRDRVLTVIKPLPNSPASRAGILAGDRIVRINSQPTFGMALEDLMEFMRGTPGTHVMMRVLRDGGQAPMDIALKREVIQVDSVTSRLVEDPKLKILHVTVESFSAKTSREILTAMKSFKRTHGAIDGMIMDLRSNPGGLLDQAVQVTDLFLEDGVIVSTRGRREEVEYAGKGYDEVEFPLVVLIDEESASASEIVAGALQDHGRAVVVGRPSFGKGSVQTVFELPYEAALKLTIARYFTPANRSIQNVGIIPDMWVQPLIERGENLNLLGQSRYRNEGFLLHRLDEKLQTRQHLVALDERMSESCCAKAYVMAPRSEENDTDESIEAARLLVAAARDVANRHGQDKQDHGWAPGRARSLVTDEVVRSKFGKLASEAANWLRSKFGIAWEVPNGKGQFLSLAVDPSDVEFTVQSMTGTAAVSGADARFLWTLTNKNPHPLQRVSVYLRASGFAGETKEILVGSINPGETRSGNISARVPFAPKNESWDVDIGVALDAWPVAPLTRQFHLDTQIVERPSLNIVSSITAETGGVPNGVLDPGEKANLHIVITNEGHAPASDLEFHVVNLSGARVSLGDAKLTVSQLAPGAVTFVDLPVLFNGNHVIGEVDIGVSVDAREMEKPLDRQITLPVSVIAGRVGVMSSPAVQQ